MCRRLTGKEEFMKTLLVVSHCILNTASKVAQDESLLAEEYRLRYKLLHLAIEQEVQLLQLPCPEFILYGSRRWGHVKEQFAHPHFRKECGKMLEPLLLQLEEYQTYPEEFKVLGIVSVEGSPSCGYRLTCTGNWGGEIGTDKDRIADIQKNLRMKEEPGVFMQILQKELEARDINIPVMSMEEAIERLSPNELSREEREEKHQ
jgi:predicted secreted protein